MIKKDKKTILESIWIIKQLNDNLIEVKPQKKEKENNSLFFKKKKKQANPNKPSKLDLI